MTALSSGWESQFGFMAGGAKGRGVVMWVEPRLAGRIKARSRLPELSLRISWEGVVGERREVRIRGSWAA